MTERGGHCILLYYKTVGQWVNIRSGDRGMTLAQCKPIETNRVTWHACMLREINLGLSQWGFLSVVS
jgi:hypothetical protein